MPVRIGVDNRRAAGVLGVIALIGAMQMAAAPEAAAQERRESPPLQEPTGAITLRDAVTLALMHNPGLAAYAWETRAREARAVQAGTRPNPTLSVLAEDLGATAGSSSATGQLIQPQTTIQLAQLIELGGKRAARRELAERDRDLAAWDYEAARIDVITEVSRAFTDVLVAQETIALTEQTTRTVEDVHQSVGARVVAGVVSPIEETRATVALALVRVEAARARRTLDASRARLAALWGSSTASFTSATGDLRADLPPLPLLRAIEAEVDRNPAVARWAAEMAARDASLAVERSKRVLDVSIAAGYRRFTDIGGNALLIGASVPLPLFDRNRGAIEEARSRVAQGYEQQRAARARITAGLTDAYAALGSAHDEVTALADAVLPGSQQTFDAVSEGYRLGRFGYLDVLDAQRTLISAGSQYLRALSDYHKAIANVERLIGTPLAGLTDPPTTPRE